MFKHSGWLVAGALVCLAMAGSALSGPTTPSQYDGCVYTSAGITLSDGQPAVVQCDSTGHVLVAATATLTNPTVGAAVPATANYIAGNKGGLLAGVTIDASGYLNVDVAAGSITITNPSTGAAVPATANYIAGNKGGNLVGALIDANGALTVGQLTAANFNATVTQGPSAALGSGWAMRGDELADTTGTFTNATQTTSITATGINGYDTALLTINGTYGTATAVFEGSDDGGVTFYPLQGARTDGTASELGYTSLTNITRAWVMPINGMDQIRIRSTAVASGTVNVRISVLSQPSAAAATNSLSGFGASVDTNNGVTSANSLRVTLSSDSTGQVKLATGANTIGALTANQSVNLVQANGTTLDTNSGVKSAGTMRFVLATDQPALTNKLLVTPDSVALPANQSVNVAQMNGVTTTMGNGVSGTGVQRVAIASDNTAFSVNGTLQTQTDTVMVGGVNVKEINGVAPLMGNGVTGTGSPRVTLSSDNTTLSNVFAAIKIDQTTPGTTNAVQEIPGTTGGLSTYVVEPGASDNHVNIKNGAGQVYGMLVTTKHTAAQYMRLYDAGTGFNGCNSATNLKFEAVVPAVSTGAGFAPTIPAGLAFATGISICFTGAYGNTYTTSATASVSTVNVFYK